MRFRACVVVPVFNHGDRAAELAERLAAFGLHTFLVNDGSEDSSRRKLDRIGETCDWVEVLEHPENRGKGAAVMTGLRAAHAQNFSHALQIDADGQHDANDIPKFVRLAQDNPTSVILGRPEFDKTVPKGRLIARYLTHVWIWIETLSFDIRDSMCGFRVYPLAPVIDLIDRARMGERMDFDPEILVRLHWEGVPMVTQRTRVAYPAGGQSHFRLWHDNCLISWMHTRLVFGMLWRLASLRFWQSRKTSASTGAPG